MTQPVFIYYTQDEIADVHNLSISTTVNGEVRQSSNTNQLIFKIPQLISYLSGFVAIYTSM